MDSRADTVVPSPASPTVELKSSGEKPDGIALTAQNTIDVAAEVNEKLAVDQSQPQLATASTLRKLALLLMFTFAQFLDAFNNSALLPAIPEISAKLDFVLTETVWIISAYQLTFAAFLLVSGRIADVFSPKPAFIAGCLVLGVTHLIGGFVHQKIAILVLRALGGIGGALTIPSALSLIVQLFPDPEPQARAISLFGSAGAIGNISGILIGAVLVQYAGWPWIFWFVAIVGVGIAVICLFLIPKSNKSGKKVNFDVIGVSILTSAVILFIFAVTSGSTQGWPTAYVLAPLAISLVLLGLFFLWESRIPPDDAVLPPRIWSYSNFTVLAALSLLPFFWWVTSFVLLTQWWQDVYGWTAISTAVHFLPFGIGAWLISLVIGKLPNYFSYKQILLAGLTLAGISTTLLPFADAPSGYWRFAFPAFIIGTVGMQIVFSTASIAIFAYTPPNVAGTVGAVFNCALQLGSAVGLAAVSSISTSVDQRSHFDIPLEEWKTRMAEITSAMWRHGYAGKAASYWFLLGIIVLQLVSVSIFFKTVPSRQAEEAKRVDVESA